jgi:2-isopropylmalate synthase
MPRMIRVFDTTLRDGEQSPGAALTMSEKLTIAHQLAHLQVDVIEAGFPYSSPEDFQSVKRIAEEVPGPVICGLARTVEADIVRCHEAVKVAAKHRIHTFIGTSDIHIEKKLGKTRAEVLEIAVKSVALARSLCEDVEFSPEDAMRTDIGYLREIVQAAIEAGASTINIPDTVGYTTPWEMEATIRDLFANVPSIAKAVISVHCHNDLGMATANSLAAVRAGAGQVECTVNGMGERAGNASLEEIVMTIKTREAELDCETGINTRQIMRASRMVSNLMGFVVQPNKAIVGANAFAHEAGIHQHGMTKDRTTYEIMTPEEVGLEESVLTLGPRSGRHGLRARLVQLGYEVTEAEMNEIYPRFLQVADRKKRVYDEDLELLMRSADAQGGGWSVEALQVTAGTAGMPVCAIRLRRNGKTTEDAATGNGPVDAAYNAIDRILRKKHALEDYSLRSISAGKDAQGEATVRIKRDGIEAVGRAASTDVVEASVSAYLNACNRLLVIERMGTKA